MSEYIETLETSTSQEDVYAHSLDMSDLSPTSELLLSSYSSAAEDQAYYADKNHERLTAVASMETGLRQSNFDPIHNEPHGSFSSHYNDILRIHEPKFHETRRKAFFHERLSENIHERSITIGEPKTDFANPDDTRNSARKKVSHIVLDPRQDIQNVEHSSFITSKKTLNDTSSRLNRILGSNRNGSMRISKDGGRFYGDFNGSFSGKTGQSIVNGIEYGRRTKYGDFDNNGLYDTVGNRSSDENEGATMPYGQIFDGELLNGNVESIKKSGDVLSQRDHSGRINKWTEHKTDGPGDLISNASWNSTRHGEPHLAGYNQHHDLTIVNKATPNKPRDILSSSEESFTTEDVLSKIFRRNLTKSNSKVTRFAEPDRSIRNRFSKTDGGVTSFYGSSYDSPPVQTNVANYYDKLGISENGVIFRETDGSRDVTTNGSRKGIRSKSSELPLRENSSVSASYGLSKSWSSSKTRNEFQAVKMVAMPNDSSEVLVKEKICRSERITQMFRKEQEIKMERARAFQKSKLLRKMFTYWFVTTKAIAISADRLCRTHLLKKGMNGLKRAVELQKRVVDEFYDHQRKTISIKYWQRWQHRTRERQRQKIQNTFTQWHYYKLHIQREKLLDTMANKHILSKNYSKWKAKFKAKQNNSIATVHFKINLIYQCWQSWTLYTKQRRAKNHMNSIASYCYGERTQRKLFVEWKDKTQKSLLCRRLARRRVLLRTFYQWKHWTQYAKIVHLRLQNMCKQYHRRTMMTCSFKKWRQALRMKQSIAFWEKNQLRRTLKLWKLRYMRKKIHKHLCKALAKKAKKRRFFEKWTRFIEIRKETRSVFVKSLQSVYFRTFFNRWRSEAVKGIMMKESFCRFRDWKSRRALEISWQSWKFQMKIVELRKRSKNNWCLRRVRKCCEVWKLRVKKRKLVTKLDENRFIWEVLMIKRFFRMWLDEKEKARIEYSRSMYVAIILKKNALARIFQAWRVVNQEECIIESMVRRRERKEMARIYDAWRHYMFREKCVRRRQQLRTEFVKRETFGIWRFKLWSIRKREEVEQTLRRSKLQRNFQAWMEYVKDVHLTEKMRAHKTTVRMRKFIRIWKENAERKRERRGRENGDKAYRGVLLVSFFTAWQRKTSEQVTRLKQMEDVASTTHERLIARRSLKRWFRQYTIEILTREYLKSKITEQLRKVFLAWRNFANEEFEQQVSDFTANLILDSSLDSAFLSTSGYQTSLKNSATSLPFVPRDDEGFTPLHTPRSRPMTPTRSLDDSWGRAEIKTTGNLPSFRPITMERQHSNPGYQTPPPLTGSCSPRHSPLVRQQNIDQSSQTAESAQRSSDDDAVPSSGVHSAGEESDQDNGTSIHVAESVLSFQTTSDGMPRDRELLVADTIIHWRSLPLSVAFRSWCKYTQHMSIIRNIYGNCVIMNREKLLTVMLRKWRRWLYVTVLARQHWLIHLTKEYFLLWVVYRKQQVLNASRNDQAQLFLKTILLKQFFTRWKNKKTTKRQLQSIVGLWQKNAVVTDKDKIVIHQFKQHDEAICLKSAFRLWKKMTQKNQQASHFCKTSVMRRYLSHWRSIACYRAGLGKKMNAFRNTHLMSKMFQEWRSRYEDNRTAKILLGVSDERKIGKAFKAWHQWASVSRHRRKTSLAYHRSREHKKLKAKFVFWTNEAKKRVAMREHYNQSLLRRTLKSWRNFLTARASISGSIQDFHKIIQRNKLRISFFLWRKRTQHSQLLSEYLKKQVKRKLANSFEHWRQQKKKSVAKRHCLHRLKKKMFTSWCQEITKRKKARRHFKTWHTIAEGTKELNQVADNALRTSENKLLKKTFCFWKDATRHAQVATYHHNTKAARRLSAVWREYASYHKKLSLKLQEFQLSHQKNNLGLLRKYMKIWRMKSACSTKADVIQKQKVISKYWKVWHHNFVRQRISSAMVDHDNIKILSGCFFDNPFHTMHMTSERCNQSRYSTCV